MYKLNKVAKAVNQALIERFFFDHDFSEKEGE
ncbi:MAG: hypothetical protein ACJAUY_000639 [Cognaticolwellia sp.]|jgi:hypothetical protein